MRGGYILILGIYRPHTDTTHNFVLGLEAILNHDLVKNATLALVAGDMNININDPSVSEEYISLMHSHNFLPTILRPTRYSNTYADQAQGGNTNNGSNLDHIWLGTIAPYISGILLFDVVDHLPTFLLFHYYTNSTPEKVCIKSRPFSEQNLNALINNINQTNWDKVLCNKHKLLDVHESCQKFETHLNKLYCNNFPLKIKYLSTKRLSKPWFTQNLKKLIDKKSSHLKKFRMGLISKEANNRVKNEVFYATRNAKQQFYKNSFDQAKNNMYKHWKLIKNLLGSPNKPTEFNNLNVANREYTNASDIAEQFNTYFSSIGENLASQLPPANPSSNSVQRGLSNSFYLSEMSVSECFNLISYLKMTKTNIDSMPVRIFKQISPLVAPILCMLINLSFNTGTFPNPLKVARITPIYKKGDKSNPGNYRPIASLPYLSKIYERAMANRLIDFFDKFNIIHASQFGFQRGKSTSDAIHHLTEFIYSSLHDSKAVLNVQLDLRKAFDTVDYELLNNKLFQYGIRGIALAWLKSYLSNRQQYVCIKSESSDVKSVHIGVPQGSILGPILFLVFINDLPLCSEKLHTTLFADDTTLSIAHKNYNEVIPILNTELSLIYDWMLNNRLSVNVEKTELMLISNKKFNHSNSDIVLGGENLSFTDSSMFLGLKFDNKLKFSKHTADISGKISKSIGIFSKIKHYLPTDARLNYYYSFLYPYLSYNIIFWGKTYETHLKQLKILQKRMIRFMTDSDYLAHTDPLFYQLKLLKLDDIYTYFLCIYMFRAVKEGKYQVQHDRNTRNRNMAQSSFRRLTPGQQSVNHRGPKAWNSLPNELKNISTLTAFKKNLKTFLLNQYSH